MSAFKFNFKETPDEWIGEIERQDPRKLFYRFRHPKKEIKKPTIETRTGEHAVTRRRFAEIAGFELGKTVARTTEEFKRAFLVMAQGLCIRHRYVYGVTLVPLNYCDEFWTDDYVAALGRVIQKFKDATPCRSRPGTLKKARALWRTRSNEALKDFLWLNWGKLHALQWNEVTALVKSNMPIGLQRTWAVGTVKKAAERHDLHLSSDTPGPRPRRT